MAMHAHTQRQTNWVVWGGAAAAVIVVIAALGYGFDWFGGGSVDAVAPAVEEIAPVSE